MLKTIKFEYEITWQPIKQTIRFESKHKYTTFACQKIKCSSVNTWNVDICLSQS